MIDALVITPVKDSKETVQKTISAIAGAKGNFEYIVFNDFSNGETRNFLENTRVEGNYKLINLEDYTRTPSPNYKLVLQMGQKIALDNRVHLILVESDVIIGENTITNLIEITTQCKNPGLIGIATVDQNGSYNFPYSYIKNDRETVVQTHRSISFCCTLISYEFLNKYCFDLLPQKKDWFDIFISHQSRNLGFINYLITKNGVLHLPHSSRPWKQLKYTHPIRYYFYKLLHRRDRI
jgi:hypothetical protein